MAEFVQLRLEECLGELEQLERVGLFSTEEIKRIAKNRKQFEYKIQRLKKTKDDFMKYIQYEINLLKLIGKRRKQMSCQHKRAEIDHSISNRISKFFKTVEYRYQSDVSIWLSHIDFCKSLKYTNTISRTFARMLQVHSDKPEIWIAAAKWEMEDNNATETARKMMLRALRFHPQSKQLYHQYFRIELQYVDLIRKRKQILCVQNVEAEEVSDVVLDGGIAKSVYSNAIQSVTDADFHIPFIKICEEFDFTEKLKEEILIDLCKIHEKEELVWNFIAQRELISQKDATAVAPHRIKSDKTIEEEIKSCIDVYKTAVEQIPTVVMYKYYIEACFSMRENSIYQSAKSLLLEETIAALDAASQRSLLSEDMYKKWVFVLESVEDQEKILEKALNEFSSSVPLWEMYIKCKISENIPTKEMQEIFNTAMKSISVEDTLPLWQLAVDWLVTVSPEKAITLLKKSLQVPVPNIIKNMKIRFLELTAETDGVKSARKLYKTLCNYPPINEDFFWKMYDIERTRKKSCIQWLRRILEDIILNFGKTSVDVWLQYIELEQKHADGNPALIPGIHWRAVKTLDPELENRFLTTYTLKTTMGDD